MWRVFCERSLLGLWPLDITSGTLSPLTSHLSPLTLRPTPLTFVFDHLKLVVYIRQLNDESPAPLTIGLTLLTPGAAPGKPICKADGAKYPKAE